MIRKFSILDYCLILIGLISLGLGVQAMLKIPTLIFPAWFLVIMFGSILLLIAFGLGALIRSLTNSRVHLLAATSIIVSIVCLAFYVNEYRPAYTIYVADNFTGDIKLFRSKLDDNRLSLNKYGVGYITDKAYRKGFRPIVYRNGKDITKDCKTIVRGDLAFAGVDGTSFGPFSYVGFSLGDNINDTIWSDLNKVIEKKIIDTSIIK